jgi:branched-chain amino acid transport system permease protein
MQAVSHNHMAAALMGISVDRIVTFTFMIGSALAAAGVLVALQAPRIEPYMGILPGLKAFVAAVLGGIGNIPGAVLGGLLIGVIRAFGSEFVGETWTPALVFAALIAVLVFRPSGLLGARVRDKV